MKKNKKIIVMLLVTVLCIGFSATSIQAATPRTILTLEVWENAPSNKVSLIAAITVNDSDHNKIVGTKGIVLNPSTSFVILDEIDAGLDDETKVVLLHL